MSTPTLKLRNLKKSIAHGNVGQVIDELIVFTEGSTSSMTTEIFHTSSRFKQLESEKLRGQISLQDYKIEYNSITLSLLEILDAIQHSAVGTYQNVSPIELVRAELRDLATQFEDTDNIKSLASNLRMKIHIARKMAEKLIPWSDLMKTYKGTTDEAFICAIGRKIKVLPNTEDIEVLESIVPNAKTNVAKGFLTNAIAELIYAGQLRWGDEERIQDMLDILRKDGDRVLLTNVERVQAALDVVTGQIKVFLESRKVS